MRIFKRNCLRIWVLGLASGFRHPRLGDYLPDSIRYSADSSQRDGGEDSLGCSLLRNPDRYLPGIITSSLTGSLVRSLPDCRTDCGPRG